MGRKTTFVWLCLLWSLGVVGPRAASAKGARDVAVGIALVDITALDEAHNTFTAEMDAYVAWRNPDLGFTPASPADTVRIYTGAELVELRATMWRPEIYPANAVGQYTLGGKKIILHHDGRLEFTVRVTARLRAPLDFRRFPFDEQTLVVGLESFPWNRDAVHLVADETHTSYGELSALTEWEVTGLTMASSERRRMRDNVPFSNLEIQIRLKRHSGFYLWKIFLTVIIIVALTWVVFWMSGERLGRRAGISSSGILTVIAYQFVTTSNLPKVSYLTVADKVMLLSVIFIAGTMLESLLVDDLSLSDPERKARIDRICRVAFPVGYLALLAVLGVRNGVF